VDFLKLEVFLSETELVKIENDAEYELIRSRIQAFSEETNTLDASSPQVIARPEYDPRNRTRYRDHNGYDNKWWESEDALRGHAK
jgi:hypothetical protein